MMLTVMMKRNILFIRPIHRMAICPFLIYWIETHLICAEGNEKTKVSAGPKNNYKDVKGYDNVFSTLGKP